MFINEIMCYGRGSEQIPAFGAGIHRTEQVSSLSMLWRDVLGLENNWPYSKSELL